MRRVYYGVPDESNIRTFEQKKLELQNLEQTRALDNGTKTLLLMAAERDAKRRKIDMNYHII